MELARAKIRVELARVEGESWEVSLTSPVFQHRVAIEIEGMPLAGMSDNWFDLYPGRTKTVTMSFAKTVSKAELQRVLRLRSLVDSYE
jgi:beta-mannosidase